MTRRSCYRHDARRDKNEPEIVQALKAQGFHVTRITGKGVPDLLVSKRPGFMRLVEVKTPKGRYKPAQVEFQQAWQGPPIVTLRSVEDALRFMLLACEVER